MSGFARFTETPTENLATVLAFDPGGLTGWCALSVEPETLSGTVQYDDDADYPKGRALHDRIVEAQYGQIDCGVGGVGHEVGVGRGHGDVNIVGEIAGITSMVHLSVMDWPKSAVILEEFTLEQMEKSGDLLYPVRVMAGFWAQAQLGEDEFGSHQNVAERIFISRRADAKGTCTDARLRQWKLFDSNSGPHARDATRHAYHFLRKSRGGSLDARQKRYLAWPHLFEDPAIVRKPKRVAPLGERIMGLK